MICALGVPRRGGFLKSFRATTFADYGITGKAIFGYTPRVLAFITFVWVIPFHFVPVSFRFVSLSFPLVPNSFPFVPNSFLAGSRRDRAAPWGARKPSCQEISGCERPKTGDTLNDTQSVIGSRWAVALANGKHWGGSKPGVRTQVIII